MSELKNYFMGIAWQKPYFSVAVIEQKTKTLEFARRCYRLPMDDKLTLLKTLITQVSPIRIYQNQHHVLDLWRAEKIQVSVYRSKSSLSILLLDAIKYKNLHIRDASIASNVKDALFHQSELFLVEGVRRPDYPQEDYTDMFEATSLAWYGAVSTMYMKNQNDNLSPY